MNNIKIFETEQEYLNSEKLYPQVSHCLDTDMVYVEGAPVFNEITIKVNGNNKSPVKLINPNSISYKSQQVTAMYVDDIRQSSVTDTYVFNDTAEHTVKFGYAAEVKSLNEAFIGSKMTEIDFTNYDFTPTKDISYIFGSGSMINNTLTNIILGDGTNLENAEFTNVIGLFYGCTVIKSKPLSICKNILAKAKTNNYSHIFQKCAAIDSTIIEFNGISDASYAFEGCVSIKSVNLKYWPNNNAYGMFENCKISSLNLSNLANINNIRHLATNGTTNGAIVNVQNFFNGSSFTYSITMWNNTIAQGGGNNNNTVKFYKNGNPF